MAQSSIEWTEQTWNPVTGCTKISPGCKFCYAEKFAGRLKAMGSENYRNGFRLTLQPQMLKRPLSWKKPSIIFVNSMSDLFHKNIPMEYIIRVFEVMNEAHWHQFQILTKRPERVLEMNSVLPWAPNIWMGTSVEHADYVERIDLLRRTSASIKFLSLEPLLSALPHMDLTKIDWVIVGGESGFKARPIAPEWVLDIQQQCRRSRVPFSLSNGVGKTKRRMGGRSMVALGTKCRALTSPLRLPDYGLRVSAFASWAS